MPHHHVLEAYGTKKTFIYNFNNAQKFISRSKNTNSIKLNRTYKTSEKSKILTSFIKSLIKNNKKNIVKQNEILNLTNFKILKRGRAKKNILFYLLNPVGCIKTLSIRRITKKIEEDLS